MKIEREKERRITENKLKIKNIIKKKNNNNKIYIIRKKYIKRRKQNKTYNRSKRCLLACLFAYSD